MAQHELLLCATHVASRRHSFPSAARSRFADRSLEMKRLQAARYWPQEPDRFFVTLSVGSGAKNG
jgi:hypothetical protein